jgi:hypothetical protein
MQVPTYAKYIKDILGNKKTLPNTEVVLLTEERSAAILYPLPEKKKDPECPTITCSIGAQHFKHALCDVGESVNIMPKVVYDKLNHHVLAPTAMCLQLPDQSIHYPTGIAENIPVKIWNFFVLVDFVILDMELDIKSPLILGRPFLSTANAHIDVGAGEIQLNINGQKERFAFRTKIEQCSIVKTFNQNKKSEKGPEKPSTPSIEALIEFMESLQIREEIKVHNQRNAKRRIQRKKFLELEKKEIETSKPINKVWQRKVSSPTTTPSGDNNGTQGMESPTPDSKPELSP